MDGMFVENSVVQVMVECLKFETPNHGVVRRFLPIVYTCNGFILKPQIIIFFPFPKIQLLLFKKITLEFQGIISCFSLRKFLNLRIF